IVFYPRRKQADLVPALAALECVIRHKPNRTSIAGNAEFLPSLDGQIITSYFTKSLSSPGSKNISLLQKEKRRHIDCHPVPRRGALAIVANEGRVAVDAEAPLTRGADAYDEDAWS
ncbi:MAG TPA: hypothetical protein VKR55_23345, partial [Bradyrhizobium sp.]|uniref:hypothetical protein n=1 Tax=Bradyrhizobium sp. TaxID=376 RepID=UPI002B72FC74